MSRFRGLSSEEVKVDEVLAIAPDAPEDYILKVDIEYPEHLHDTHSDYPLAPETLCVPEPRLSGYQRTLVNKLGCKFTGVRSWF